MFLFHLFYDQIRTYCLPLNAAFSMWPPSQFNCPPLTGVGNSGPRAKCGPPQRFQWPAEAFRKYVQIWIFPPIYHSKC